MGTIINFLTFLNLTEYTKDRLSWSNISLLSSLVLVWYVALSYPDNLAAIFGSFGTLFAAFLNYAHKRQTHAGAKAEDDA